ncbi:MAG: hypothetical protein GXO78_10445 [Calditrichaeota bacterium]|nr:hypothetical protein [Calditrichota bacterium]
MNTMRLILLNLIWIGCLWGQAYNTYPIGDYWIFPDARTLGLAGSGSVSNTRAGALMLNPAAMGVSAVGVQLEWSPWLRKLEERRSYPLYNRIDDITQQAIYAQNLNWFADWQGGVVVRPDWGVFKALAVGRFMELDQNYVYREEVRKNIFGDSLLAENQITVQGRLHRYSLGMAFQLGSGVFLGLQVGFLKGGLEKDSSIQFYDNREFPEEGARTVRQLKGTPLVVSAGGIWVVNPHVRLGASVQLPYTVRWQYRWIHRYLKVLVTGEERHEYPLQATVGFEYRARQELQARLNIDVSYFWWSQTRSRVATRGFARTWDRLQDAIQLKVGIEHLFFNRVPFRVGVQFRTAPENRRQSRTLLTAGTGFRGKFWQVDLSGGISHLSYRARDVFDDALYGGFRADSVLDTVEENFFFGVVSVRVGLRAFGKTISAVLE